jgi:mannose-6-phosphate isomerase-like protein (cupin superfamily)
MQKQREWSWSPAAAAAIPIPSGRQSAPVFDDEHVEVRYYAPPGRDEQQPHERDELYVIASGSATFERDGERKPVARGELIHVPAGLEHRFLDLSDDFATWVVFYG